MSDQFSIPPTWMPWLPMVTSAARSLLTLAAGAGFTYAQTVTDSDLTRAVSVAMIVASVAWSAWQKYQTQKALNKAAASPKGTPAPAVPA